MWPKLKMKYDIFPKVTLILFFEFRNFSFTPSLSPSPPSEQKRGIVMDNIIVQWIMRDIYVLFVTILTAILKNPLFIFHFLSYFVLISQSLSFLPYTNGRRGHLQRLCFLLGGFNVQFKATH
jgi:hypothetical protein